MSIDKVWNIWSKIMSRVRTNFSDFLFKVSEIVRDIFELLREFWSFWKVRKNFKMKFREIYNFKPTIIKTVTDHSFKVSWSWISGQGPILLDLKSWKTVERGKKLSREDWFWPRKSQGNFWSLGIWILCITKRSYKNCFNIRCWS